MSLFRALKNALLRVGFIDKTTTKQKVRNFYRLRNVFRTDVSCINFFAFFNDMTEKSSKTSKRKGSKPRSRRNSRKKKTRQAQLVILERTFAAYNPIKDILGIHHKFKFKESHKDKYLDSLARLLIRLLFLAIKDRLEVNLKTDFQLILARANGMELMRRPIVFSGKLWHMIKLYCARANQGNVRQMRSLRSLYESKSCWYALPDSVEKQTMEKHKKLMSTPGSISEETENYLKMAVDYVFPPRGHKRHVPYSPGICAPTKSSGYSVTRGAGGNRELVSIDQTYGLGFTSRREDLSYQQFLKCAADSTHSIMRVIYQSIPEPGKFRVITKGDSNLYTAVRPLQKYLLRMWKKQKFATMTKDFEERLHRVMNSSVNENGRYYIQHATNEELMFCSVDYSSATDLLKMNSTTICVERIIENLGLVDLTFKKGQTELYYKNELDKLLTATLFRKCMKPCIIEYPDGEEILQKGGQLMGNPLSFPLLCIINLSCFLRLREHSRDLHREKLFINGDDIVFQHSKKGFKTFIRHAGEVGLKVNKAKSYVHPDYYLINSILGYKGKSVGYMNIALALGHRVKSEPKRLLTQARLVQKDFIGYPLDERKYCLSLFYKSLHEKVNFKIGRKKFIPNYFIHQSLGGLGLENLTGANIKITPLQRKVATFLYHNLKARYIQERVGDIPNSVKKSLQDFRKISPVLIEIPLLVGPLIEEESLREDDTERIMEGHFKMCLDKYLWLKDGPRKDDDHYLRLNMRLATKKIYDSTLLRDKTIINFIPRRYFVDRSERMPDFARSAIMKVKKDFGNYLSIKKNFHVFDDQTAQLYKTKLIKKIKNKLINLTFNIKVNQHL
jgi:hypothetical protein